MVRAYADEEVLCMLYEFNIGCSVEQPKSGGNYFRLRETRKFLSLLYKKATNMTKTRRLRIKLGVIDVTSMKKCLFFPRCYWSTSFFFLVVFSLRTNVVQKSAVLHMDGKTIQSLTERRTLA